MPFPIRTITIDGREIELDYYGRVIGSKVVDQVMTTTGLMECTLQREYRRGEILIIADLWQGSESHGSAMLSNQ